jgi:glycosyltransferase involved in cell wall biosynthesis
MHVMHVIDGLYGGGAETSILEVAPALVSRGVETSIVALKDDDGGLEHRLTALGIALIRLKPRNLPSLAVELRHVIRAERPDLLHTTLMWSNLVGRITARTVNTPVVTTLANRDYGPEHQADSRYGRWGVRGIHAAELASGPLTACFHAVSEDVATIMGRRLKIPNDRIRVVYRGRDPSRMGVATPDRKLRVRAELSVDATAPLILSVGRLDRQKGIETTIAAFQQLITQVPNAVLLLAGRPGNASALVEAQARDTPGIRLLGHRTDVPDLMCAADVLSFPSRWEGLPGTIIEAMAMRLGIVASRIAPVVEVLGHVNWPLVPPDDPPALASGLASILRGGSLNEALRDTGEERFRALFTSEAASEGMANLYQDVLQKSPCRRSTRDARRSSRIRPAQSTVGGYANRDGHAP